MRKSLSDPQLLSLLESNEEVYPLLSSVGKLVSTPAAAKSTLETLSPLADKQAVLKCLEVLLLTAAQDEAAAKKALEQVQALPINDRNLRAMWQLSSELVSFQGTPLATQLLEHIVPLLPGTHL